MAEDYLTISVANMYSVIHANRNHVTLSCVMSRFHAQNRVADHLFDIHRIYGCQKDGRFADDCMTTRASDNRIGSAPFLSTFVPLYQVHNCFC